MRLAVVTDIHHGRVTFVKQGPRALGLLEAALRRAREAKVDAVVELGDRISDVDAAADFALESEVGRVFAESGLARHHICGNHDRAHLSADRNAVALNAPLGTRAVELGDIRLAFWEPDVSLSRARGFSLAPGDLESLRDLLGRSDRRTILFSHAPLSGHSMRGNYWFENNPAHATYAQIDDIRKILAEAPCPLLAIAGHVHWNSVADVDGTTHLTLHSLSDSTFSHPEPSGAFGWLTVEADHVLWRVDGLSPVAMELPFPAAKSSRPATLPRFSDLAKGADLISA
ncbi:MAG: metallophosphoesterase family protein [Tagaea sp.]|nr:metallophosphoesterase family protein [Azospirillum sp.]MCA3267759.1 metallophosphoesterase family protein [Azospirillum sp.]MCZ8122659.1 metallophosphoesterase family protein [Magnetospirillum sp.]